MSADEQKQLDALSNRSRISEHDRAVLHAVDNDGPNEINHQLQKKIDHSFNRIFCFGSGECDQFFIGEDVFETKKPIEIPFFFSNKIKICSIVCGSQHSLILSSMGEVFTWGNSDGGCLGTESSGQTTNPQRVALDEKVNLVSAGDANCCVANAITGTVYVWGTFRNSENKFYVCEKPFKYGNYQFGRNGIGALLSGSNHILILTRQKVFSWGDPDLGALGIVSRSNPNLKEFEPRCIGLKKIKRAFAGFGSSFFEDSKGNIFACGLNNYNQLGLNTEENINKIIEPIKVPGLKGNEIIQLSSGEHHTLLLLSDGRVYGCGRNDDGQLGKIDPDDKYGHFHRISHLNNVEQILSSNHFNYGVDFSNRKCFTWGLGFSYVLGNGKEDTVETPHLVDNDKIFSQGFPSTVGLGHSHVVYSVNPLSRKEELLELLLTDKRKSALIKRNLKKINK